MSDISLLSMGFTKPRKPPPREPVYVENNELRDIVDTHVRINGLYKNDNFNFATVHRASARQIDDFEERKFALYNDFNLNLLIESNSKLWILLFKFVQKYHNIVMQHVNVADARVLALVKGYRDHDEKSPQFTDSKNYHINNPKCIEAMHQNVVQWVTTNINIDKQLWDTVKKSGNTMGHIVTGANNFESHVYPIVHPHMCPSYFVVEDGQADVIESLIEKYRSTLEFFINKHLQCPQDLDEDKNLTTFMVLQVQLSQGLCMPYGDFFNNINRTTLALLCYMKDFDAYQRKIASTPPLPESYHPNSLHLQNAGDDHKYLDYP